MGEPESSLPRIELAHRCWFKSHYLACCIGSSEPVRAMDLWGFPLPPLLGYLNRVPESARMLRRHHRLFQVALALAVYGSALASLGFLALTRFYSHLRPPSETAESVWLALLLMGLFFLGLSVLLAFDCFRYFLSMVDAYNAAIGLRSGAPPRGSTVVAPAGGLGHDTRP